MKPIGVRVFALAAAVAAGVANSTTRAAEPTPTQSERLVPTRIATPMYPEVLQKAHAAGIVEIAAAIPADGTPRDIDVAKGLHPWLDRSCREAVAHMRFEARPGASVVRVTFTFDFRLDATEEHATYVVSDELPFHFTVMGYAPIVDRIS